MKTIVLASLAALVLAGSAAAQTPLVAPTPSATTPISDEALADKLARDAELADQARRSNALNVEVNRKNREVQARNDAAKAAYEKSVVDYRAKLSAQDTANAKVQADYQKQVEAWKADVAACKAGEAKRCGPPAPDAKTASKSGAP
jgi:hypothetical protein